MRIRFTALSQLIPSSPLFDSVEVVHSPTSCECGHTENQHAEPDYDYDDGRYVADPRPCQVCGCTDYWY